MEYKRIIAAILSIAVTGSSLYSLVAQKGTITISSDNYHIIDGMTTVPELSPPTRSQLMWLHSLEWCESSGRTDIRILDTNDKYSYGALQFQFETFKGFGKGYGIIPESFTDSQVLSIIKDIDTQEAIAHQMLLRGLSGHWLNCSNKIGSPYPKN